ncbi:MAG: HNH endonuclease, partial [Eubacterium sp.]
HFFYNGSKWKKKREEVLKLDHYECQICKENNIYTRAEIVHHVNHLKDRPDMRLNIYFYDEKGNKKRQLISVCRNCHETKCHPERMRLKKTKEPLTIERW